MSGPAAPRLDQLGRDLRRLRGEDGVTPDAAIVVPVNAQGHLDTVFGLLADLAGYRGQRRFEVVLVVNNFPPGEPPPSGDLEAAGAHVVCLPDTWQPGVAICLSARIPGLRAASAAHAVLFDADCRLPDPSALLDWYVDRFAAGYDLAYTRVDFYDLRPLWSVRVKVVVHHAARAVRRVVFRMPSTRGSNYGLRRAPLLRLYDDGLIADDLNVGPTMRAAGARVAYSSARQLRVLTSGHKFQGGWARLSRQLRYRLLYNLRMLPVRPNDQRHPYHDRKLR
ncbi:MAG: hypothetical protein ACRDU8_03505 [Egibacteraceae bacterium]